MKQKESTVLMRDEPVFVLEPEQISRPLQLAKCSNKSRHAIQHSQHRECSDELSRAKHAKQAAANH